MKYMIRFIETNRLILSPVNPEDLKGDYMHWINDPAADVYTQHALFPHTSEHIAEYYKARVSSKNSLWLGIFTKEDQKHIGNIDISGIDWINRSGIYNILIGNIESQNKGYAFEASVGLLEHVFNKLNLHRIQLGVHSDNTAALKLYKKLGFVQEGLTRQSIQKNGVYHDTIVMGLLHDEFTKQFPTTGK